MTSVDMLTDELTGTALSEAVAKALGWTHCQNHGSQACDGWLPPFSSIHKPLPDFANSLDVWLQYCWPDLQARGWKGFGIHRNSVSLWRAGLYQYLDVPNARPSEAACRAYLKAVGEAKD